MAILERDLSVPGNCSFDVEFDGDILVVKSVYDDEQYESVDTTFADLKNLERCTNS